MKSTGCVFAINPKGYVVPLTREHFEQLVPTIRIGTETAEQFNARKALALKVNGYYVKIGETTDRKGHAEIENFADPFYAESLKAENGKQPAPIYWLPKGKTRPEPPIPQIVESERHAGRAADVDVRPGPSKSKSK